jgi:uncharacterized sporulation protein YeaH/YhbH (DUF444 family)
MSPFRFPLQKVLNWRRTELELQELKFREQSAALAGLDRDRAELEAAGIRAELQVRDWAAPSGRDLAALNAFRLQVRRKEQEIATRRADCQRNLAAQQALMLEARRRCRLLERLKERRLAEWQSARDREMEVLASESFLAQWSRREA